MLFAHSFSLMPTWDYSLGWEWEKDCILFNPNFWHSMSLLRSLLLVRESTPSTVVFVPKGGLLPEAQPAELLSLTGSFHFSFCRFILRIGKHIPIPSLTCMQEKAWFEDCVWMQHCSKEAQFPNKQRSWEWRMGEAQPPTTKGLMVGESFQKKAAHFQSSPQHCNHMQNPTAAQSHLTFLFLGWGPLRSEGKGRNHFLLYLGAVNAHCNVVGWPGTPW